jgi:hypothetical protein
MNKDIQAGEMVTVNDQRGEFIVHEVHPERKTADLMVVTAHPVKLKDVPVCNLNKSTGTKSDVAR